MKRQEAIDRLMWLKSVPHINDDKWIEAVDMAIEALQYDWVPVSEGLPEEREWVGTKRFGTTISDFISITFEVDRQRFVKVMRLQNGGLGFSDKQTMDAIHKGWKILAWKPLPDPYKGE